MFCLHMLTCQFLQDQRKAHPLTYSTLGYGNLRKLAEDAGLTVT